MTQHGWYRDASGAQYYWDGQKWAYQYPVIHREAPRGPDHTFHLLMTLLTCGLWIPVWIAATIVSKQGVNKVAFAVLTLVAAVFAVTHWQLAILLGILVGVGYAANLVYLQRQERKRQRLEAAARADEAYRDGPQDFLYPPSVFDPKD